MTTGWRNSGCRAIMALVAVAARENMRGRETSRIECVNRNRLIEGFLSLYLPPESLHYSLRLTPPPPPVHPLLPSSRSRTIGDASHTQRPSPNGRVCGLSFPVLQRFRTRTDAPQREPGNFSFLGELRPTLGVPRLYRVNRVQSLAISTSIESGM